METKPNIFYSTRSPDRSNNDTLSTVLFLPVQKNQRFLSKIGSLNVLKKGFSINNIKPSYQY